VSIAVVSHAVDDHAAAVARALFALGSSLQLIDLGAFPVKMGLSFTIDGQGVTTSLIEEGRTVDLGAIGVIWWRRPQPHTLDAGLDPSVAAFTYSECHEAMAGALQSLHTHWVNSPAADEVAHHKPLQLAVAQQVGLSVPRTLITNDPDEARIFITEEGSGRTIYKTFLAQEEHWRETRVVGADEIGSIDSVRHAPVIFQRFIEAEADLRITVFGEDIQVAEIIASENSYRYDYRVDLEAVTIRPATLPSQIKRKLIELMRRLGLVYGAIDMRRTADGDYVFLEINPAGEFLFVELRSGLRLTEAMAALLMRLDKDPLPRLGTMT
jgi:glutathione synthase/RimK-type ligase-like ATP-grasp enzyme